ncbi:MAG: hypothetical protein JNL58_20035 [Planctomyces sp.]|nr:hypothetical protein [Planctomyces sp.]
MRRFALLAAAVVLTAAATHADQNTTETIAAPVTTTATTGVQTVSQTTQAPAPVVNYRPVQRRQQSFFGRVMELERRKNAWIRRTLFQ